MRVSVVVCTYNRADALGLTLDALRYQQFPEFEVVVVNGPSTDHTPAVLDAWSDAVKVVANPLANLSVSRNVGIRAAAGDLVAFIDDDAIAEFDWLADIVAEFERDVAGDVAGVGGLVFDHTGTAFQFRFAASSRLGEPMLSDTHPFDDMCLPGGFRFPYLQGTNAVFRRDVLSAIGGFDETFDYYLDETDLCARIVDAGYRLRQLDDAHVHHKFLPSALRNEDRIFTRWYPVIKNLTYFGYRHALDEVGEEAILAKSRAELEFRAAESEAHEAAGRVPAGTADRTRREGKQAIDEGIRRGRAIGNARLAPLGREPSTFVPFPRLARPAGGKVVVVVSSAYGPTMNGGISRFITDVVPELVALGHEIRVVTRSSDAPEHARVDFEDGVWVHRVTADRGGQLPGTAAHIDTFATAALEEVRRIATWRPVDVVYGPAWDMEVLPIIRATALPVVAFVATPVAVTNHLDADLPYDPDPYASLLLGLEREIFTTATLLHADSNAVVETIRDRYGLTEEVRASVALLGAADAAGPRDPVGDDAGVGGGGGGGEDDGGGGEDGDDEALVVLFVGRLEPRKGIDTLLDAFAVLAPELSMVRLVVVGSENLGEGEFRRPWLARHAGAEWLDRVEFTGQVGDDELNARYGRADVVVLPSRYESFGLTVVEAMRHGRPVVSTTAGAIPELLDNGVEGLLVAPGDVDALASALRALVGDPARRASLGAAARRRYEEQFTIGAAAERLSTLLGEVRSVRPGIGLLGAGEEIAVDTRPGERADIVFAPSGPARARADLEAIDVDGTAPLVRWRPRDEAPGRMRIGVMRGRAEVRAVHLTSGRS